MEGCCLFGECEKDDPKDQPIGYRQPYVTQHRQSNIKDDCSNLKLSISRVIGSPNSIAQILLSIVDTNGYHVRGIDTAKMKVCGVEVIGNNMNRLVDSVQFWEIIQDTMPPLSMSLVLDYSGSMGDERANILQEAANLLIKNKRSEDEIGIIKFDNEVKIIEGLTYKPSILMSDGLEGFGGSTALFDASDDGITMSAKSRNKHKLTIIFTDGMENSSERIPQSLAGIQQIVKKARENNVAVYVISFGNSDPRIQNITRSTGGEYYPIYQRTEFQYVFQDIYRRYLNTYVAQVLLNGKYNNQLDGNSSLLLKVKMCCKDGSVIEDTVSITIPPPCGGCPPSILTPPVSRSCDTCEQPKCDTCEQPKPGDDSKPSGTRDSSVKEIVLIPPGVDCEDIAISISRTFVWNRDSAFIDFSILNPRTRQHYKQVFDDSRFRSCGVIDSVNGVAYTVSTGERHELNDTTSVAFAFVLDYSGSIGKERAERIHNSVRQFSIQDRPYGRRGIAVVKFNTKIKTVLPMTDQLSSRNPLPDDNFEAKSNTALWDAANHGLTELQNTSGYKRKALILFTDGKDNSSAKGSYEKAINSARDAGIPIFTVPYGNDVDLQKLEELSIRTGGTMKRTWVTDDVDKVFNDIGLRYLNHYRHTFRLQDTGTHHITIKLCCDNKEISRTVTVFGGSPGGTPDIPPVPLKGTLPDSVFFAIGSAQLTVSAKRELQDSVLMKLKNDPDLSIYLYAFSSPDGNYRDNWRLSIRRANAILSFLKANGIDASRIKSYGCGPSCRILGKPLSASRRVEFYYTKGPYGRIEDVCPACKEQARIPGTGK